MSHLFGKSLALLLTLGAVAQGATVYEDTALIISAIVHSPEVAKSFGAHVSGQPIDGLSRDKTPGTSGRYWINAFGCGTPVQGTVVRRPGHAPVVTLTLGQTVCS
jgi:hypothetical protein